MCIKSDAPEIDSGYSVKNQYEICKAASGTVSGCRNNCILPQKKLNDYEKACSQSNGKVHAVYERLFTLDEAKAENEIGCHSFS